MNYIDKNGNIYEHDTTQDKFLRNLYESRWGRILLKPLISPAVSKCAGWFLDSGISRFLINRFIKSNEVNMEPYIERRYLSFNDFFTREIKPEERMIDYDESHLISPSDGKVSVYPLKDHSSFEVKQTSYTIESLLQSKELAGRYKNGYAVVIRLTVDDYHRYCYPCNGKKSWNRYIPGVFHTVNPAACELVPVYKENSREYTMLKTEQFGTIIQMEVGALMVGRICNYEEEANVKKGHEKGKFEFGGSTIILLIQDRKVNIREDLLANTVNGCETIVKMGECIGSCE